MTDMRQRAEWMSGIDDAILEHVSDEGVGTAKVIGEQIGKSASHISDRLRELSEYGLIDKYAHGVFVPNEATRAYLNETLDASELEPESDDES